MSVLPNPLAPDQVMVGYRAGFMMLWNTSTKSLLNILKSNTLLNDLCWRSEDEFYSCHSDGSYIAWDAENGAQLQVLKFIQKQFYLKVASFSLLKPHMDLTLVRVSTKFIVEKQNMSSGVYSGKYQNTLQFYADINTQYDLDCAIVCFEELDNL